jgi:hypothetical protein
MKPGLFLFLFYILIIIISACGTARKAVIQHPEELLFKKTFERELPMILEKIPVNYELLYGFRNRDEFQEAYAGIPFNYFSYNDSVMEKSLAAVIPVLVGNEYRALVSLDYVRDTLHIVDFGAKGLAKEIQEVISNNNSMSFIGLLRIYRVNIDFAILTQSREYMFFPLTSAKSYLRSKGIPVTYEYYNQNQVLTLLSKINNE